MLVVSNGILAKRLKNLILNFLGGIEMKRVFMICTFFTLLFVHSKLQATTVENIINNPGNYDGESVTVEGVVTQYVEGNASTTSYYILKGYYGGKIKVNTASVKPEVNQKYKVSGIVYIDPISREPFISEQSKSIIGGYQYSEPNNNDNLNKSNTNTQVVLMIGLIILLLISVIIFYIWQKKGQTEPSIGAQGVSGGTPIGIKPPNPTNYSQNTQVSSPKTVRIPPNTPNNTLKFVPGKFIIKSGIDKGTIIAPLQAYPDASGSVITVGREDVQGPRAQAHIKIDDSIQTVSRMQAEIIYKNNKVFIKNLSKTNYTEVNGYSLQPNQVKELRPGAIIKMGELEWEYQK